jgi:glycosyl transferase family 25
MSHYIDAIFYINLDKRVDRKQQIEEELEKFGLKYERFSGLIFPDIHPYYGCSMSHLSILKIARERVYKNVLILEDDFYFNVEKETFEDNMKQLFETKSDFDVFMLAPAPQKVEKDINNPLFYKIIESSCGAGYLVQSKYYDRIITVLESSLEMFRQTNIFWVYTVDQAWKPLQPSDNWLTTYKFIGRQRRGFSDCGNNISENDWEDTCE